ncbi:hypothetical protein DL239_21515 [Sedimentitalea sp. CY04]|uniref:Uncharacterized protein n=1 Tax=Parasedimentitalea denitrificans TaxID=2211118 RepID=A0ABX0WCV0_9RHOB|nr:hypothetical protein [Sedimentitalea sp. CY04]NIZ63535.1 hypothetical protein [Sedimentitalea sp. CY04]
MASQIDITGFHKDEYVEIQFFGRDREGGALSAAAGQVIKLVLSKTAGGDPVAGMEWTSNTSHITLVDEAKSEWKIALSPDDLSAAIERKNYFFNIWSQLTDSTPILQAEGGFTLKPSIKPS